MLDNVLQSAASIRSTITRSAARSPAASTEEYVNFVVGVLNAGSLPAALQKEPISEQKISAQLGDDTIRSGTRRHDHLDDRGGGRSCWFTTALPASWPTWPW